MCLRDKQPRENVTRQSSIIFSVESCFALWFISCHENFCYYFLLLFGLIKALIVEEPSSEPKETHPANLVSLRTQASSLRDQILRVEKEEEVKGTLNNRRTSSNPSNSVTSSSSGHSKSTEKLRKKLAEVEAQLVLALPSLVFQVTSFPLLIDLSLCNLSM